MPDSTPLRLGSRGSALARWQAEEVCRLLEAAGQPARIEYIRTSGDRKANAALAEIGGKGQFTLELEEALRTGQIDAAVHSLKDVPTVLASDFVLAAIPVRGDARDVLVGAPGSGVGSLAVGARVGTSSLRRQSQLLALRPDLRAIPLRGNVDSRLGKLRRGECEALLLAAAGLVRLKQEAAISEWIATSHMCPAAGQGALAVECRTEDAHTRACLRGLHHVPSGEAVRAERAMVRALGCDCQSPVGAFARFAAGELRISGVVAVRDGSEVLRVELHAEGRNPEQLGEAAAERLVAMGAERVLADGCPSSRPSMQGTGE